MLDFGVGSLDLYTERLILRQWKESDAESLYRYAKDPRVGPSAGWPVHTSIEYSLDIIRSVFSKEEIYAVCKKEDNIAIGCVGLKMGDETDLTRRDDEAEVGYWLGVPFWGKGYIPEAVRAIQRHAFEDLGLVALWCGYYDGNDKSRHVQEKCGFTYRYTTRDVEVPLLKEFRTGHVCCITREEWERIDHNE